MVGAQRVPYWQGGRAYEPYAMGYFGAFGPMTWMFMGGMMFGDFGGGDYGDGGEGGGDGGDGGGGDGGGGDGGGFDGGGFDGGGFDMGFGTQCASDITRAINITSTSTSRTPRACAHCDETLRRPARPQHVWQAGPVPPVL